MSNLPSKFLYSMLHILTERNTKGQIMAANQQAKRDVVVSKDALLKSYRKRLKVRSQQIRSLFSI